MSGSELFPIVAKNVSETGASLKDAVGNSLADVWQTLWGDRLAAWRLRNAAQLNEVLGKELAERGLELNFETIPERFAYSWFEKASQEDEPEVQELFAKLLANAAEGNEAALNRRNIEIVSQLGSKEAWLIKRIAKGYLAHLSEKNALAYPYQVDEGTFYWELRQDEDFDAPHAIDTLLSLRIIENDMDGSEDEQGLLDLKKIIRITATGESLIGALFPQ